MTKITTLQELMGNKPEAKGLVPIEFVKCVDHTTTEYEDVNLSQQRLNDSDLG